MKVLIDRNIEINAITHKTVVVPQVIRWGPHNQTLDVAQRVHFFPRDDESFRREQLPYLAALCACAKEGKLEFFSSHEIRMEKLRQKGRSDGYLGINMLRHVPIKSAPCPIHRSIVISAAVKGLPVSIGTTEAEQMEFFQSIKHPRFLEIRNLTGDAHIDDAYHLWTAEEAGLDAFLTMDQKFWRVVNQKKKLLNSSVLVMTPKELSEHLGLQPINIDDLAAASNPFS